MSRRAFILALAAALALGSIAFQAGRGSEAPDPALPYIVHCALPANQVVRVGEKKLRGYLGLAPDWGREELSREAERSLSGCLMALTNAFGRKVRVSVRVPDAEATVSPAEIDAFPVQEGAFFGNLYETPSVLFACGGSTPLDDIPSERACTRPRSQGKPTICGFEYVGLCADRCASIDSLGAYRDCTAHGATYARPTTVYTRRAVPAR